MPCAERQVYRGIERRVAQLSTHSLLQETKTFWRWERESMGSELGACTLAETASLRSHILTVGGAWLAAGHTQSTRTQMDPRYKQTWWLGKHTQPDSRAGNHRRHKHTRTPAYQRRPTTLHEPQRGNLLTRAIIHASNKDGPSFGLFPAKQSQYRTT